jgi:hypothetical protein
MFGTAGLPHILMRFFTVPNAKEARKSVFYATGFIGFFFLVVCTLGFAAMVIIGTDPQYYVNGEVGGTLIGGGNMVAMHLAKAVGGNLFFGFLSAVAFATILAVVSGLALAGASAISHDLYATVFKKGKATEKQEMRVTRMATVGLGIIAILLGILFEKMNVAFLVGLTFGIAASTNFPVLTMMNYERLSIGIQGIGCAEASYQSAVTYARERVQSRAPTGAMAPTQVADPIIVHPDVRRMLLSMKAMTEGGRAFASYVGQQLDLAKFSDDASERDSAQNLVALLTPVAKAFFTDSGLESCIHGQQVFGGHGYVREWGQEQLVRDVRIAQIYEGTNGIQALDLLGRKVVANHGVVLRQFTDEIRRFTDQPDAPYATQLLDAVRRLENLSDWVQDRAETNRNEVGAASVEYLHLFGYVAYAWLWARMAHVAGKQRSTDEAFYGAKIATADFYIHRLLPRILSLEQSIRAGSASLYGLTAEQF